MLSIIARRGKSITKFMRPMSVGTLEFEQYNMALGSLSSADKKAFDGCAVCYNELGPDTTKEGWKNEWLLNHDGYNEKTSDVGAQTHGGNCPLRQGNHCGKYCCKNYTPLDPTIQ